MKNKVILLSFLMLIGVSNNIISKDPGAHFFKFATDLNLKKLPGNSVTQDLLNYDSDLTQHTPLWLLFILAYPVELMKNICLAFGKSHFE